jgi:hypothetical protein
MVRSFNQEERRKDMPTSGDFQTALDSIFSFAKEKRIIALVINSGNLHRLVGGYPGTDHRMPICCSVMLKNMKKGDEILDGPPSVAGASLIIKYQFPRG